MAVSQWPSTAHVRVQTLFASTNTQVTVFYDWATQRHTPWDDVGRVEMRAGHAAVASRAWVWRAGWPGPLGGLTVTLDRPADGTTDRTDLFSPEGATLRDSWSFGGGRYLVVALLAARANEGASGDVGPESGSSSEWEWIHGRDSLANRRKLRASVGMKLVWVL